MVTMERCPIIVGTRNRFSGMTECLDSLIAHTPEPHDLIVVFSLAQPQQSREGVEELKDLTPGMLLEGVVTITDLLRGRSMGATVDSPVSEFMTKNPVALTVDDDCAIASSAIREYRLKSLPVVAGKNDRRLLGCIRARRLYRSGADD